MIMDTTKGSYEELVSTMWTIHASLGDDKVGGNQHTSYGLSLD